MIQSITPTINLANVRPLTEETLRTVARHAYAKTSILNEQFPCQSLAQRIVYLKDLEHRHDAKSIDLILPEYDRSIAEGMVGLASAACVASVIALLAFIAIKPIICAIIIPIIIITLFLYCISLNNANEVMNRPTWDGLRTELNQLAIQNISAEQKTLMLNIETRLLSEIGELNAKIDKEDAHQKRAALQETRNAIQSALDDVSRFRKSLTLPQPTTV